MKAPTRRKQTKTTAVISIPDRWLQGACYTRRQAGMGPLEALRDAVAWWQYQAALEKESGV